MSAPVERLERAIKRLEQHKSILGHVSQGEDETELYVRVEEDWDEDGNASTFGLQVGGTDMDAEISGVIVELARTIDAQMEILRDGLRWERIIGSHRSHADEFVIALADSILEEA